MQCIVVTPEKSLIDAPAEFVAMPLVDGEIGIAHGHTPLVWRLGVGELRITHEGETSRYYVENGFVEIVSDVITLLTNRAVAAEDLDKAVLQEQLDAVRAPLAQELEQLDQRYRSAFLIRAQLRVARRAAGSKRREPLE